MNTAGSILFRLLVFAFAATATLTHAPRSVYMCSLCAMNKNILTPQCECDKFPLDAGSAELGRHHQVVLCAISTSAVSSWKSGVPRTLKPWDKIIYRKTCLLYPEVGDLKPSSVIVVLAIRDHWPSRLGGPEYVCQEAIKDIQ